MFFKVLCQPYGDFVKHGLFLVHRDTCNFFTHKKEKKKSIINRLLKLMQFDLFWLGPALRYSCSSPCKATEASPRSPPPQLHPPGPTGLAWKGFTSHLHQPRAFICPEMAAATAPQPHRGRFFTLQAVFSQTACFSF